MKYYFITKDGTIIETESSSLKQAKKKMQNMYPEADYIGTKIDDNLKAWNNVFFGESDG